MRPSSFSVNNDANDPNVVLTTSLTIGLGGTSPLSSSTVIVEICSAFTYIQRFESYS